MKLFQRRRKSKRRVVFIGLDGSPYSLLTRLVSEGRMPNLAGLLQIGNLSSMDSIYPTVSSVAWSSMMTGKNPAKHGIFGFVDRTPGAYKPYIPTSRNMTSKTLWEHLSDLGKRVIVMNVPVTYPPRPVNGVLVAGFLAPRLEKATFPPEVGQRLQRLGYRIDTDPWAARKSKDSFLTDFRETLEARERALMEFLRNEPWDYFHCHIMETDRLHHFLWELMEDGDPKYAPAFYDCYRQIDELLGRVRAELDDETTLMLMADHGFCSLRKEVYVNTWLRDAGYLRLKGDEAKSIADMEPSSRAYSLDPGRVFIHLRGREPNGCVEPGDEYEHLREEIAEGLLQLRNPDSDEEMIERVFRREEIYEGTQLHLAADLIAAPRRGYDLKGAMAKTTLTFKGDQLIGTHTFDDAMLYIQNHAFAREEFSVVDVMPTILEIMGLPAPPDLDGSSVL